MGVAPYGALSSGRIYKFHDFQPISGYMWEMIQYSVIVTVR